jgi:hypothetical protein
VIAPIAPREAFCRCGARRYASEAEASKVERSGLDKCPVCQTFARDHGFWGDEFSDYRCYDCDVRSGSHGGPQ